MSELRRESHLLNTLERARLSAGVWTQVENERATNQAEAEARRDKRDEHGGAEASEHNE